MISKMEFQDALYRMKRDSSSYFRRESWETGVYVHINDGKFERLKLIMVLGPKVETYDYCHIGEESMLADDWIELDDPSKITNATHIEPGEMDLTLRQIRALQIVSELERKFNEMTYEEKLKFAEKYPDFVTKQVTE